MAQVEYAVLSQRQHEQLLADGRFVAVMAVTFQTPAGVVGTVDVPLAQYTPEYVHAAISDYVERIEAVHRLGGPNGTS